MKRLLVLLFLFASTAVAADPIYRTLSASLDPEATVRIDGKFEGILFEPATMLWTVKLESGTHNSSHAFPADWTRDVRFYVTKDHDTEPRPFSAAVVRQHDEEIRIAEKLVDHRVSADFRLDPVSHGRYKITVSYDDLSQTPGELVVVRGDENAEIRDWTLQRQIEKAKTWEETKRLELKRIENNPRSASAASAWFALGAGAEQFEDYQTTNDYYEKAISIWREIGGPVLDETVRRTERIVELLPAYFADREHLFIARESFELRKRKPPLAMRAPEKK